MMTDSVIVVRFNETTHEITTKPVYQYDHGLSLKIYGIKNENINQVHFSNTDAGKALNILTSNEDDNSIRVSIPDTLQILDKDIFAFVYVEDDTSGFTAKKIKIPVIPKAKPETLSVQSPQLDPVGKIVGELEDLIETVDALKDSATQATSNANTAANKINNMTVSATELPSKNAPTATISEKNGAKHINFGIPKGNVMYATFDLDPNTGILYMITDEDYAGPEFALTSDGYLEVSI